MERRILVHMHFGRDAGLACRVLEGAGFDCVVCQSLAELCRSLREGAGAVLTAEEVLPLSAMAPLTAYLAAQPTWSDIPILVLTKPGGESPWIIGSYERLGNLTLLERPVRAPTLISAARSALRARERQYEIRRSEQRKDEYLAMLAHELRNPLAPISAAAQLLEYVASDPEKVKVSGEIITRQIGHMKSLIDDLLDVARVTRGLIDLRKEPLDMHCILAEAVEQVSPLIRARRQRLSLESPTGSALVLGDRKRLIQVVVNLLNNATKYTQEGGELRVRSQVSENEVSLTLSDNGIGMSQDTVHQVFDLFAQAKRTSDRAHGGLGLGLALVKSLVSLHGGSVRAESQGLDKGSTFTVRLPRLCSAPGTRQDVPAPDQSPRRQFTPLRILVVDDNADAATSLGHVLDAMGHEVTVATSAVSALDLAERDRPQVCLLDIGMPEIDGYDLARRLKARPEMTSTYLVAITGYGHERDRQHARSAGFDQHFVKPVDVAELMALLADISRQ